MLSRDESCLGDWLRRTSVFLERPEISLTMPLFAYFDESGKFHDGSGYVCLCGYLGDDTAWEEQFHKRWIELLSKYKFGYIHMTEFDSECKRRGWENRADDILSEFIEVIRDSEIVGFSVGVDGAYFKDKYKKAGLSSKDPAQFAVGRILAQMRDAAQRWGWKTPRITAFSHPHKQPMCWLIFQIATGAITWIRNVQSLPHYCDSL